MSRPHLRHLKVSFGSFFLPHSWQTTSAGVAPDGAVVRSCGRVPQRGDEVAARGESVLRVFGEGLSQRRVNGTLKICSSDRLPMPPKDVNLFWCVPLDRRAHDDWIAGLEDTGEGWCAGEEFIEDAGERVLVGSAVLLPPEPLFRRHVGTCAACVALLRRHARHRRANLGGQTEVQNSNSNFGSG